MGNWGWGIGIVLRLPRAGCQQGPDGRGVVICELKTQDLTLQELAITSY
ncbi:hypothetical protein [Microcoleus sp. herbarium2]